MVALPHLAARAMSARAPRPRADLVTNLMEQGAYHAALSILTPQLASGAADPVALDQAATCHWQLEEGEAAIAHLDRLVAGWPDLGSPCVKLASYAASMGQTDRARAALDLAMARGLRSAQALALLNRLDPIPRDSAMARRLKTLARDQSLCKRDQAIAQNTLGKIEDHAGRYRAAFRWFAAANRTHGKVYHPRAISARVASQILSFDPTRFSSSDRSGPRFLFITGMPRSGTTVLEHSLSRHSQIRALGESVALSRTAEVLRRAHGGAGAWDWVERSSQLDRAQFQDLFLSFLPADARDDRRVLVTKMPLDLFDIGVAAWLWPQARFVHLDRHPMDVGLSNFTTLFHQGHGYAQRLDWTAHMIRAVDRSMSDYVGKLGGAIIRQSYRALVTDPEPHLRAILRHSALDWDDACLTPQASARPVQTASIGQLTPGFTARGLGKWRRYEAQLAPLARALGSDWLDQWEGEDSGPD